MKKHDEFYEEKIWNNERLVDYLGLRKRSITPTTLKKVEISKEDKFYKEFYDDRYKNTVVRFAFKEKELLYKKYIDNKPEKWESKKSDTTGLLKRMLNL